MPLEIMVSAQAVLTLLPTAYENNKDELQFTNLFKQGERYKEIKILKSESAGIHDSTIFQLNFHKSQKN